MRARLLLAAVAASATTVAVAGGMIASGRAGGRVGAGGTRFAGATMPAGMTAPRIRLRDQDGRLVDSRALRGRVVVLTFMDATCRDTCPLVAQQIRGALDDLGHDLPVLAVSVAPQSDTTRAARRFIARQSMIGRMRFLLGGAGTLAPIWRAYGIAPQQPAADHSSHVFLLDANGRPRVGFPADHLTPEGLAADMRRLEAGA
jgi:protein SCO1